MVSKKEFRSIIKIGCIYTSAVVGMGFASGQEIMRFFTSYYSGGFYGIVLLGILFSLIGCAVLDKVYRFRIRSFEEFMIHVAGRKWGRAADILTVLFMISFCAIMTAASADILLESLNIPFHAGIILTLLLCMLLMLFDIRGLMLASSITTPVLILGIILIGLYVIVFNDITVFGINQSMKELTHNWFSSALAYTGFNSIVSTSVLCNLLPLLKSRRTGILAGITGGISLLFLALLVNIILLAYYPYIVSMDMPMLEITRRLSSPVKSCYTFILWLAAFVSLSNTCFCLIKRARKLAVRNFFPASVFIFIIVILLSAFGFSKLAAFIYPFFGCIGICIVLLILVSGTRELLNLRKL